jgi:hypothetical protein
MDVRTITRLMANAGHGFLSTAHYQSEILSCDAAAVISATTAEAL